MITPRWYQDEASDAPFQYMKDGLGTRPLVLAPTGAGKTLIIALICEKFFKRKPNGKIVILSDRKEILSQNIKALKSHIPQKRITGFSAGLGQKRVGDITVAGIQTAYNYIPFFKNVDLLIVDECHLIPTRGAGRYRTFLNKIDVPTIGLTATHYRLGHGYIHIGDGAFFDGIAYDLTSLENYNRLVEEGFLTRLITPGRIDQFDVSGIGSRGGDYKEEQLSSSFDRDDITDAIIQSLLHYGKSYKRWLLFTIDIQHANNVTAKLNEAGISAIAIHSQMAGDRDVEMQKAREGVYRAVVNVNVLTTGYDDPMIDLIGLLKASKSPVYHVQTIGRGARVHDGKDHTLVLDWAGNTKRLGPINDIQIVQKGKRKKGPPIAITKDCPDCGCTHHPSVKWCDVCGHEFEFKLQLSQDAFGDEVVATKKKKSKKEAVDIWHQVQDITYAPFEKKNQKGILVTYSCGLRNFKEWVCLEYKGYAGYNARHWLRFRMPGAEKFTVEYALENQLSIMRATEILVRDGSKFPTILDYRF